MGSSLRNGLTFDKSTSDNLLSPFGFLNSKTFFVKIAAFSYLTLTPYLHRGWFCHSVLLHDHNATLKRCLHYKLRKQTKKNEKRLM